MPLKIFLALTLIGLAALQPARSADDPSAEEKGQAIAAESIARDTGWGDMKADMQMILRNRQGEESLREIRMQSLEQANDGDKSLTIFDKPLDVKGTAFLSFSHAVGADDQWLYLPALKRVKRISSRNKSGPFMGSEFAYEDLSSFEIEKYSYKYIKDESVNGLDCFVVEQYPADQHSGYTRRLVWIDKAEYRVRRVEFYDRKNSPLKTLSYSGYQQYLDRYWRPERMDMINHQSGKSTELRWTNYHFGNGLNEADFNKNSLKRAH
jgi:outer membrane lipoprotein-sorting protein